MSELLEGILDSDLKENSTFKITVNKVFENLKATSVKLPIGSKSTGATRPKSLNEFYGLVKLAINDYEKRAGVTRENRVNFTEEEPDVNSETESVVFSLISRSPGQFAQGKPMSQEHVNLRPMFRDSYIDPSNPSYRCLVTGYYYDNIVRFTCWARTNKRANFRAEWLESLMEEYSWWFKLQGVDRTLFRGRNNDMVTTVSENKWYGRPLEYFVRTEKLRVFHEKTLEEILVNLGIAHE